MPQRIKRWTGGRGFLHGARRKRDLNLIRQTNKHNKVQRALGNLMRTNNKKRSSEK